MKQANWKEFLLRGIKTNQAEEYLKQSNNFRKTGDISQMIIHYSKFHGTCLWLTVSELLFYHLHLIYDMPAILIPSTF